MQDERGLGDILCEGEVYDSIMTILDDIIETLDLTKNVDVSHSFHSRSKGGESQCLDPVRICKDALNLRRIINANQIVYQYEMCFHDLVVYLDHIIIVKSIQYVENKVAGNQCDLNTIKPFLALFNILRSYSGPKYRIPEKFACDSIKNNKGGEEDEVD